MAARLARLSAGKVHPLFPNESVLESECRPPHWGLEFRDQRVATRVYVNAAIHWKRVHQSLHARRANY